MFGANLLHFDYNAVLLYILAGMSFSERELADLTKAVDRAVNKYLGKRDVEVTDIAVKSADRGYDRKRTRERLERLLNERDARKLADKLSILVEDFKSAQKRDRDRKRKGEDAGESGNGHLEAEDATTDSRKKRGRYQESREEAAAVTPAAAAAKAAAAVAALIGDKSENGGGEKGAESASVGPATEIGGLNNSAISAMMANAKSIIEQRRAQLLGTTAAASTVSSISVADAAAADALRRDAAYKAQRAADLQAQIQARLAMANISGLVGGAGLQPE